MSSCFYQAVEISKAGWDGNKIWLSFSLCFAIDRKGYGERSCFSHTPPKVLSGVTEGPTYSGFALVLSRKRHAYYRSRFFPNSPSRRI